MVGVEPSAEKEYDYVQQKGRFARSTHGMSHFSPNQGDEGRSGRDLADVQSLADTREIPIDKVGVKGIVFPIQVLDKADGVQSTVATIGMSVSLPHHFKGTHMSRFMELLNEQSEPIAVDSIPGLLKEMKTRLQAESAHIDIAFPYFLKKKAPVSGVEGLVAYQCRLVGAADRRVDIGVEVRVPVTTLCPCSREISERGAHNQRGQVCVFLRFRKMFWIEDIIEIVENAASCEVYSVLKRVDEKYVTEKAYDNPVFVEDLVREIAAAFLKDENIRHFSVEAENLESIHSHNAYAFVEHRKA
jgi:GTP cyclohydrolase I